MAILTGDGNQAQGHEPLPSELEGLAETSSPETLPVMGTVLAVQANFYFVQIDPPPQPQATELAWRDSLLCTRRSRLKKIGQRVMVGDRVHIEEPDWDGGRGAIAHVLPRRTELDRPPMANANQILLLFALAEPPLDPLQLSRFLVKAESTQMAVRLCLNKQDLLTPAEQQAWRDRLAQWGYDPLLISVQAATLDAVHDLLQDRITLVSGPSGVGKSSLLNALIPQVDLRVGAVSGKLRHGRHTTRHVELFELPNGGLLADSPGFNQPELACSPTDLADLFPEIRQRQRDQRCQFHNCLHRDEPGCVVQGDWERYEHYRLFLEEAIARQAITDRSPDAESTTKQKNRQDGQIETEPKLSSKRYRRPSRRTEKQALQDVLETDIDFDQVFDDLADEDA